MAPVTAHLHPQHGPTGSERKLDSAGDASTVGDEFDVNAVQKRPIRAATQRMEERLENETMGLCGSLKCFWNLCIASAMTYKLYSCIHIYILYVRFRNSIGQCFIDVQKCPTAFSWNSIIYPLTAWRELEHWGTDGSSNPSWRSHGVSGRTKWTCCFSIVHKLDDLYTVYKNMIMNFVHFEFSESE